MKILKVIGNFLVIFHHAWCEALAAKREYAKKYNTIGE